MDVKIYKHEGRMLVMPVNEEDMALFMHCSGGSVAVTVRYFNEAVKPLLFIHGVEIVSLEDTTTAQGARGNDDSND